MPFLIEKPELQNDRLFTETQTRMSEPEKFDALLAPWLMDHDKWEVARTAQELRLAITPVLSPKELFSDPQLLAREFFETVEHPELGQVTAPGVPAKFSETAGQIGRAPLLGEHNLAVLSKLGLTRSKIKQLQKDGVV